MRNVCVNCELMMNATRHAFRRIAMKGSPPLRMHQAQVQSRCIITNVLNMAKGLGFGGPKML